MKNPTFHLGSSQKTGRIRVLLTEAGEQPRPSYPGWPGSASAFMSKNGTKCIHHDPPKCMEVSRGQMVSLPQGPFRRVDRG